MGLAQLGRRPPPLPPPKARGPRLLLACHPCSVAVLVRARGTPSRLQPPLPPAALPLHVPCLSLWICTRAGGRRRGPVAPVPEAGQAWALLRHQVAMLHPLGLAPCLHPQGGGPLAPVGWCTAAVGVPGGAGVPAPLLLAAMGLMAMGMILMPMAAGATAAAAAPALCMTCPCMRRLCCRRHPLGAVLAQRVPRLACLPLVPRPGRRRDLGAAGGRLVMVALT